jgi:hypothetical protein
MPEPNIDPASIAPVDLPARIDRGYNEKLVAFGTAVHDVRPLYVVRPARDVTYVETNTGERRCGPSQVIVYDRRTDTLDVIEASVVALRYAPIAAGDPVEREPAPPSEPDKPPEPTVSDEAGAQS